jgi:Na+/H+-dicarboxylate symporter
MLYVFNFFLPIFTILNFIKVKNNKLFILIIISLIIGVALGGVVHYHFPEAIDPFSKNIKLLGTIFIRLVQMIIAPLVFSTLVVGIAKMGDMKMVGRVGGKAMAWFISA